MMLSVTLLCIAVSSAVCAQQYAGFPLPPVGRPEYDPRVVHPYGRREPGRGPVLGDPVPFEPVRCDAVGGDAWYRYRYCIAICREHDYITGFCNGFVCKCR
ncbi:uncharacterized protein LOC135393464 [Ornithodoros turicata]|uniref:uncharacterized protein LOC135393464 n=1 Tax=Ornithodoros turicata TaxID=34597 RepID=UPI00313A3563